MKQLKQELSSYTIVGILTTVISLLSYKLLLMLGMHYMIATSISSGLAILFAYITNRKYVFESRNNILQESIKFFVARILIFQLETFALFIAVSRYGYNEFYSKVIVTIIVILLNYILSKFMIFKTPKKEDTL